MASGAAGEFLIGESSPFGVGVAVGVAAGRAVQRYQVAGFDDLIRAHACYGGARCVTKVVSRCDCPGGGAVGGDGFPVDRGLARLRVDRDRHLLPAVGAARLPDGLLLCLGKLGQLVSQPVSRACGALDQG